MISSHLKQATIFLCLTIAFLEAHAKKQPFLLSGGQPTKAGTVPCMTLPPIPETRIPEKLAKKKIRFLIDISTTPTKPIQVASCHWETQIEVPQDKRVKLTQVELQGRYQLPQLGRGMIILRHQNNNLFSKDDEGFNEGVSYEVIRMRGSNRFTELKTFEYESDCGETFSIDWQMHLLVRRPRTEESQSHLFIDTLQLEANYESCEVE